MEFTPYAIDLPDATLVDLRERLARTRWPDEVGGAGWAYGAKMAYLKDLCAYWLEGFDWRAQERTLNALPHFRTEIEGRGIRLWDDLRGFEDGYSVTSDVAPSGSRT